MQWITFHYSTYHIFFIHVFISGHWVTSTSWLLWGVLRWTWVCRYLCEVLLSVLVDGDPEWVAGSYIILFSILFEKPSYYFSQLLYHLTFPPQCTGSQFLPILYDSSYYVIKIRYSGEKSPRWSQFMFVLTDGNWRGHGDGSKKVSEKVVIGE